MRRPRKQLAIDKAKYEEWAAKFREFYDATCPNPRCHAPLRLRLYSATKTMTCVRCRYSFKVSMARRLADLSRRRSGQATARYSGGCSSNRTPMGRIAIPDITLRQESFCTGRDAFRAMNAA